MVIIRDEDPTDFAGTLPSWLKPSDDASAHRSSTPTANAATGASAAGMRALSARLVAFYFRAPAKAFLRTRIDYLHLARAINPQVQASKNWSWRTSTPGLVVHAVRTHGWGFIPNQLLPPLVANVGVGAVLYTSYLQLLGIIHPPSSLSTKRIYPPPPIQATFVAGFTAGTIQSVLAAPLDAIQNRVCINEVLEGQHKNMWLYGKNKLWNIGLQGVFAGWGISFLKESLGFGVFFASFEFVKQQLYYTSLTQYYGNANLYAMNGPSKTPGCKDAQITIKPHYALEPMFILLAGVTASVAQQVIQHPLALLQNLHYQRLESPFTGSRSSDTGRSTSVNSQTYQETFREARSQALRVGGWRNWLFKGLMRNTLRQIPSTSAGLIIFELVKRGYATSEDEQVIEMDGVRISLS